MAGSSVRPPSGESPSGESPSALAGRPAPPGRRLDRRLTVVGIGLAALSFVVAGLSFLLPEAGRRGLWLPVHLAFLGGGGTAIAAVLPFFAASLSAVPPPPPWTRLVAVASMAIGAALVAAGVAGGRPMAAVVGGGAVLVGVLATAAALVEVLRSVPAGRSSDRARVARFVTAAGLGGLGAVALGGSLAVLFLLGASPVLGGWPTIRIAHAWLNLFGFVGLVVTSTLVHLLPTVLGTRVVGRRTGFGAVASLAAGAAVGAAGFLFDADLLARLGAVGLVVSASLLVVEAIRVWRARGRWTTDAAWHRFVVGSLLGAVGWFGIGSAIVAIRTLLLGATPAAWDLAPLVAPFGAGWLTSAFLGSASHLVPSVGPGGPELHAAARRLLGRSATLRLAAFQGGVLALTIVALGPTSATAAETTSGGVVEFLRAVGLGGLIGSAGWSSVLLVRALVLVGRAR